MTREGTRPIAALAVAIFAAVLLAACGGSDSSSSTTGSTSPGSAESDSQSGARTGSTEANAPKKGPRDNRQEGKDSGSGKTGTSTGSGGSGGSDYTAKPLQVSGGGSAPFLIKGGDNSIQEFGEEASESELSEAAEVLHAFLVARANEDFSRTCSYLTKEEVQQLEQLGSQSPQLQGKGCAAVVEALAAEPLAAATKREMTEVDAASLRIEGDEAFLIYNGPNNTGYFIRMVSEDGAWKVAGLSPTAFPS